MKRLIFIFTLLPVIVGAVKAPDFTITDYNNKTHRLYSDYLDKNKVVVLKFFFVDCPPCNSLAPNVQQSYVKWGSGNNRVQFIELSTQIWDQNANVKAYAQKHGLTFPGAGNDGGSITATAPYKSGTFGPYYGTPTFAVIAPNGEVQWNVNYTKSNQVDFDSAVARALRMTTGSGSGDPDPNKCLDSFGIKFSSKILPDQVFIRNLTDPMAPEFTLQNYKYNCEFTLPQDKSPYYLVPFKNTLPNDWITGVTTADIIAIQKHILGISQLNNLQLALADVNNSGTVTAFDISELRKLILGIQDRFRNLSETHTWTLDPFLKTNTVSRNVRISEMISRSRSNIFGMGKYGDVSDAVSLSGNTGDLEDRTQKDLGLRIQSDQAEKLYKHEFYLERSFHSMAGFQFAIDLDPSDLNRIVFFAAFEDAVTHFVKDKNGRYTLRIVWYQSNDSNLYFSNKDPLFTLEAFSPVSLSSKTEFTSEAYENDQDQYIQTYSIHQVINPSKVGRVDSFFVSQVLPGNFLISSREGKIKSLEVFNLSGQRAIPVSLTGMETQDASLILENSGLYFLRIKMLDGSYHSLKIFSQK